MSDADLSETLEECEDCGRLVNTLVLEKCPECGEPIAEVRVR